MRFGADARMFFCCSNETIMQLHTEIAAQYLTTFSDTMKVMKVWILSTCLWHLNSISFERAFARIRRRAVAKRQNTCSLISIYSMAATFQPRASTFPQSYPTRLSPRYIESVIRQTLASHRPSDRSGSLALRCRPPRPESDKCIQRL